MKIDERILDTCTNSYLFTLERNHARRHCPQEGLCPDLFDGEQKQGLLRPTIKEAFQSVLSSNDGYFCSLESAPQFGFLSETILGAIPSLSRAHLKTMLPFIRTQAYCIIVTPQEVKMSLYLGQPFTIIYSNQIPCTWKPTDKFLVATSNKDIPNYTDSVLGQILASDSSKRVQLFEEALTNERLALHLRSENVGLKLGIINKRSVLPAGERKRKASESDISENDDETSSDEDMRSSPLGTKNSLDVSVTENEVQTPNSPDYSPHTPDLPPSP